MIEIEYKGESYTIKELAEMAGLPYNTVYKRLKRMSVEEALKKEYLSVKRYEYKEKLYSADELADIA